MKRKHLLAMALVALFSTPLMAQAAAQPEAAAGKPPEPAASKPVDKPASTAQILRDKIKADKKFVVAKNMKLTEAEATAFWPVYEAYQKDLADLNKRLAKMIRSYRDAYNADKMNDEIAKKLVQETLDIQDAETAMMRAYAAKLDGVIPATKVMRYLQIENKIRAIVRYDLADGIPLAP
jgi:hypothetical protein